MSSYSSVQDHRSMVFDDLRNTYYSNAIKQAVKKDSVVMDLGAGLGLHGLMAASNGARKVYLVEPAAIIDLAAQVVKANNLSRLVECISGIIEEVDLPKKVDVIISVFTGNFLLTEDLLPSLFYARDKYLKPGGKLIPDKAKMEVVPVCAPDYYAKHIDCWKNSYHGVVFEKVRSFAANNLYYDGPENRDAEFLSAPAELFELDFMTATEASCRNQVQVRITQNGLCHGWLGWFGAHLGEQWLSTSPKDEQTHWRQVFMPLATPVEVKKGDILSFELNRPEFGEWSWIVGHSGKAQQHSTFLSEPVSLAKVRKKSDTYKPQLSAKGKTVQQVLSWLDGKLTSAEIVERLMVENRKDFPTRKIAERFVKEILERYS